MHDWWSGVFAGLELGFALTNVLWAVVYMKATHDWSEVAATWERLYRDATKDRG